MECKTQSSCSLTNDNILSEVGDIIFNIYPFENKELFKNLCKIDIYRGYGQIIIKNGKIYFSPCNHYNCTIHCVNKFFIDNLKTIERGLILFTISDMCYIIKDERKIGELGKQNRRRHEICDNFLLEIGAINNSQDLYL